MPEDDSRDIPRSKRGWSRIWGCPQSPGPGRAHSRGAAGTGIAQPGLTQPGRGSPTFPELFFVDPTTPNRSGAAACPSHAHGDRALHRVAAGRVPALRRARGRLLHPLQAGIPLLHGHRAGRLHQEPEGPGRGGQDDEEAGHEQRRAVGLPGVPEPHRGHRRGLPRLPDPQSPQTLNPEAPAPPQSPPEFPTGCWK